MKDKIQDFLLEGLLQECHPDAQRLEIEEVARVIVTPISVEVYTFDNHVYVIEINVDMQGILVNKMNLTGTLNNNEIHIRF